MLPHKFNTDFYVDQNDHAPSNRPSCLLQAIRSMPAEKFREVCTHCGLTEEATPVDVLNHAMQVGLCSNTDSPVEVWLDSQGLHRVFVYEDL